MTFWNDVLDHYSEMLFNFSPYSETEADIAVKWFCWVENAPNDASLDLSLDAFFTVHLDAPTIVDIETDIEHLKPFLPKPFDPRLN